MSVKRVILHAGPPKTGTSGLQNWFRRNRDLLRNAGVDYPDRFAPGEDKHVFLVPEFRQQPALPQLTAILNECDGETLLLSNEGLANHFDDFHTDSLARFRELTASLDVSIILVRRDPEAWTRSYYKQCVLNPNNGGSPLWGTSQSLDVIAEHPRLRRLRDIDVLARDMKAGFGATAVEILPFDRSALAIDIAAMIGAPALAREAVPAVNDSLPDWAIEAIRQVNAEIPDNNGRDRWKAALQSHLKSSHSILTNLAFTGAPPRIAFNPDLVADPSERSEFEKFVAAASA